MSNSETAAAAEIMLNETYAYGKPQVQASFKQTPTDFQVNEILGFEPEADVKGQHHWLQIEKSGVNTDHVARALAQFVDIQARNVSFSGMKDRHAVTTQWFSVELPATKLVDWNAFAEPGVRILQAVKSNRKLRRGTHKWNEFSITLRDVSNVNELLARVEKIKAGVPNYFGEQRFGYQGSNLTKAEGMFAGRRIKDRNLRSIVLSAARSYLFNQYVSTRLAQHGTALLAGDVMQLTGSHSFFVAEHIDTTVLQRVASGDIEVTGPMPGRGRSPVQGSAQEFEEALLAQFKPWLEGIERAGVDQSRRAMWLQAENLVVDSEQNVVRLRFRLTTGSFATSVLRELAQVTS